jgi:hypothetical protein
MLFQKRKKFLATIEYLAARRRKKEEGRRKKEEGRRKKEEGRRKKEEGRRKKEEGRNPLCPCPPRGEIQEEGKRE